MQDFQLRHFAQLLLAPRWVWCLVKLIILFGCFPRCEWAEKIEYRNFFQWAEKIEYRNFFHMVVVSIHCHLYAWFSIAPRPLLPPRAPSCPNHAIMDRPNSYAYRGINKVAFGWSLGRNTVFSSIISLQLQCKIFNCVTLRSCSWLQDGSDVL